MHSHVILQFISLDRPYNYVAISSCTVHSNVMLKELHIINYCENCKMHRNHRSLSLIGNLVNSHT